MAKVEPNRPGEGRKNRVNISLPMDEAIKLGRLAVACRMPPTTMAYALVKHCLNDPQIIALVQDEHSAHDDYRVIPIRDSGGWRYDVVRGDSRRIR